MSIVSNTVCYLDGEVLLEGFFAYDDDLEGRRPAVLIAHAWGGRNKFVEDKAILLAEMGYFAFAVDMYGQGILGQGVEESSKLMQPFIDDRRLILSRMNAAFYAVKLLPWVDDTKVAAIGFCFGGLCVTDFARSGAAIKGIVSFHGLVFPLNENLRQAVTAKLLLLTGADDPMVSSEQIKVLQSELTVAGADWQVHSYGQTMHAFTNPVANDPSFGTVYSSVADKRSWLSMCNFLEEIFL